VKNFAPCSAFAFPLRVEIRSGPSWICDSSYQEDDLPKGRKRVRAIRDKNPSTECRIIRLSFEVLDD
jgi:hypothetical protein